MLDVSILTEVMIELVDRYLNEKEMRLQNSRELKKAQELIDHYQEKIISLSTNDDRIHEFTFVDGELVELHNSTSDNVNSDIRESEENA